MSDPLDQLLANPLEKIADDGFSLRVAQHIAATGRQDEWLTYGAIALAALPLLFAIPVPAASAALARLLPSLASAESLAAAAALLALTFSFEKLLRDR